MANSGDRVEANLGEIGTICFAVRLPSYGKWNLGKWWGRGGEDTVASVDQEFRRSTSRALSQTAFGGMAILYGNRVKLVKSYLSNSCAQQGAEAGFQVGNEAKLGTKKTLVIGMTPSLSRTP